MGVSILVGWDTESLGKNAMLPIIAALIGAFSYGIATNYAKPQKMIGVILL